jgi:rRNA-processing protein FCF1
MPKKKKEAAIIDANILIDYASVDEDLIREIVIYWKKVFVPDVILHEVRDLTTERALELGLTIIQTPYVNLPKRPKLSFQDRTCLYFVMAEKWVCIANDVPLRKECMKVGGKVVWGLEMLLFLVGNKQISKNRAKDVAIKIKKINPTITDDILETFLHTLK